MKVFRSGGRIDYASQVYCSRCQLVLEKDEAVGGHCPVCTCLVRTASVRVPKSGRKYVIDIDV